MDERFVCKSKSLLLNMTKKNFRERVAKLAGRCCDYQNWCSRVEMKKKDRVDDALHATRAAVERGVSGGGVTGTCCGCGCNFQGTSRIQTAGINVTPCDLKRHFVKSERMLVMSHQLSSMQLKRVKVTLAITLQAGEYGDMLEMGILGPADNAFCT